MTRSLTRRQVLRWGGAAGAGLAGLGLAGLAGFEFPHQTARGAGQPVSRDRPVTGGDPADSFVTRPDIRPPVIQVTREADVAGAAQYPYIFIAPRGYSADAPSPGEPGLMIVDRDGRLVWFGKPLGGTPLNFAQQQYRGQPVLTWSAGYVNSVGVTYGTSYIADRSYRVIATVRAGHGAQTDLHEFNLTPQGTALITAHRKVTADLSAVRGPARGAVLTSIAQEIDVATGRVLFEWSSLDHVGVTESYQPLGPGKGPYDYFHMNSIALADDGDLLISSRNTWTIYKVARPSGAIRWRLGGKRSDFRAGPGASFAWQHCVRMPQPGLLTVFDNASSPPEEPRSRALLLNADTSAMRVTLEHAYAHPAGLLADNQGSVQLLPDGNVFVGWGAQPYFTEFTRAGQLVLDGEMPANDQSYRAFAFGWAGDPPGRPAAVARANPARGSMVYVSWNGATQVATWAVLAGRASSALRPVGSQPRDGFETAISVNSEGPYFAVIAQDSSGREIGRSATVRRTGA